MTVPEHHDVIVIGSGFGGSVTAWRLAEAGMRVCVLERGMAWPPGSFPRTPRELRGAFWDPSEGLHGMFDVWSFKGLAAVMASGLGGGSLIYANVLLRKDAHWFREQRDGRPWDWPITRADLDPHYDRIEEALAPEPFPAAYAERVPKAQAFADACALAGLPTFAPPLAVAFAAPGDAGPRPGVPLGDDNLHRAPRRTCTLCGECDLGCNDGAKQTMDLTLLTRAERSGAQLRTGIEVRTIAPRPGGGYIVHAVEHRRSRRGRLTDTKDPALTPPRTFTADRIVLAAGALGTTYLLLRSERALGGLGPALGTRFCGNGDSLSWARRSSEPTSGRTPSLRLVDPSRGPVITTSARMDDDASGMGGYYLQDAGVPAHATWLLQLVATPRSVWGARRSLLRIAIERLTGRANPELGSALSSLFGDLRTAGGHLPLLGMGREIAHGRLRLQGRRLYLDWRRETAGPVYGRVRGASRAVSDALGARFLGDPVGRRRPATITVHALGGAPMGRTREEGVVDPYGRVFGHIGLTVACGAAMPGAVGPNPSLTIAAWADRQAEQILRDEGRL